MKIIWKQSYTEMPYNSFEHKIKSKLDAAKVQPAPDLWDKIADQLESDQTDYRPALVLPFFMRKEHVPYMLSAAAVVSVLVAIGLQFSQPKMDITVIPDVQAVAKVIEVETPNVEQLEAEANTPIKAIRLNEASIAYQFDMSNQAQSPISLKPEATQVNQPAQKGFDIQSISMIGAPSITLPEAHPQLGVAPLAYNRIIPESPARKSRFKPQVHWGLTAMSALQLTPLSSSISAPEFESNAVGISDLYSDFYYPGGIASARAEIEIQLNEKWGISSGFGFTSSFEASGSPSNRNGFSPTNNTFANNNGGNGTLQDITALSTHTNINRLDFQAIDIPLVMNYYLKRGKAQLAFSTGMLYRHLLTQEPAYLLETIDYATNAQSSIRYVESSNFSLKDLFYLIGSIQYQMQINESLAFHVGPSLQVGLGSAYSYQQFESRQPLSVGLEVGLRFFPKG